MVSSNLGGADAQVHNVLANDETEWLAEKGQGFVLRTRSCERKITGVRMKNAGQPRSSKSVRISSALAFKESWNILAETDMEENTGTVTFHFSQSVLVRFIKFELLSYYDGESGGLRFFFPTTGFISTTFHI